MSRRPRVLLCLGALLLVSGCAGPAAPSTYAPVVAAVLDEATGGIQGLVVDDESLPIEGARVALVGQATEAVTNAAGAYALDFVAPGTHLLTARHPGHVGLQRPVEVRVGEPTTVDLLLEPRPSPSFIEAREPWAGHHGIASGYLGGSVINAEEGIYASQDFGMLEIGANWRSLQIEIDWTPNWGLSHDLQLVVWAGVREGPGMYSFTYELARVESSSPLLWRLDLEDWIAVRAQHPDLWAYESGTNDAPMQYQVLAGSDPTEVNVDQRFDVYETIGREQPLPAGFRRF